MDYVIKNVKTHASFTSIIAKKETKDINNTSSKEKSMSKMSDDELRDKTTRYKLESDYIKEKNNREFLEPKKVSKAKSFVDHVGKNVISPALTEGGKRALQNITQAKIQEIFFSNRNNLYA